MTRVHGQETQASVNNLVGSAYLLLVVSKPAISDYVWRVGRVFRWSLQWLFILVLQDTKYSCRLLVYIYNGISAF